MTVVKARKILKELAKDLTNDQIEKEICVAEFLAELVLFFHKEEKGGYNGERNA